VIYFFFRTRRLTPISQTAEDIPLCRIPVPVSKEPALPAHWILRKDDTLEEKVNELAQEKEVLEEEFARMEEFVTKTVSTPSTVARMEEHKEHNRYKDIGNKYQELYCTHK
jgi:hypothetical protein